MFRGDGSNHQMDPPRNFGHLWWISQLAGGVTGGASYSLTASGAQLDRRDNALGWVGLCLVFNCRNYVFNDV